MRTTSLRQNVFYLLLGAMWVFAACDDNTPESGEVLVEYISIKGDFIEDGGSSQLEVMISPTNATNQVVEWSVSNDLVATISQEGVLTAVSNGIVTVTASATDGSQVTASKSFNISGVGVSQVLVESITINGGDITDGRAKQLSADVFPANAFNKVISWSVSDESIAEISSSGLLTPKANGSVTVYAVATDASGIQAELVVNISGVNTSIDGEVVTTKAEILNALAAALPGDKIYVRSGTYAFSSTISISKDGNSSNMISLLVYPGDDRPKFDFSAMPENSSNRGVSLSGDYWHIKGIDFYKAGDNGMFISGNNNIIEFCTFSENSDSGLQIGNGGSNNTIKNCDSYYNADSLIENADGFACKLDAGTGNKFIGCRAWQNLDDGWDGYMRGNDNITTTYENCWAIKNGYLKNGSVGAGDGNGFKTGGSDDKLLKHNAVYKNCIAAGNVYDGFDHNSNRGDITIYNCSAHSNGKNYSFSSTNPAASLIIKNSISLTGNSVDAFNATTTDVTNNGWQDGLSTTSGDFESVDMQLLLSPRQSDGSLPDISYLKLVGGSDLIDKGVDVGLDYQGSAPDLGAFELQ
ncbi:Ig-like domain-containing protein [Marinoscillum sp. MHG1-6]|uniref:Ig-like domain-containing protein n=1 Tax=Marinoscillum sp. MHG1-6 TaxID=2959627 RepID=UPI00215757F5|nr:Ig-like domain-containing protein [Marinoscillum sp. MHG1-6]